MILYGKWWTVVGAAHGRGVHLIICVGYPLEIRAQTRRCPYPCDQPLKNTCNTTAL